MTILTIRVGDYTNLYSEELFSLGFSYDPLDSVSFKQDDRVYPFKKRKVVQMKKE